MRGYDTNLVELVSISFFFSSAHLLIILQIQSGFTPICIFDQECIYPILKHI